MSTKKSAKTRDQIVGLAGPPAKGKPSTEQAIKDINNKLGILGALLVSIAKINRKGLNYYFLGDPEQAINAIKTGANETLGLEKVRNNLEKLGISKEILVHLDSLISAISKEYLDIITKLEEN